MEIMLECAIWYMVSNDAWPDRSTPVY
jgi:hypothetical protein